MIKVGDTVTFTDEPYESASGAVLECDAFGVVIDFKRLGATRFDRAAMEQMVRQKECILVKGKGD